MKRAIPIALAATVMMLVSVLVAQGATHLSLVSRNSSGTAANGSSSTEGGASAISHDGRLVAFMSNAANLPGGDGSTWEVYVRNTHRGKTTLMSTDSSGDPAGGDVYGPTISASGRYVAFYGPGNGLPGAEGHYQVWVHDRKSGHTVLASKSAGGAPGNLNSSYPSLSGNGRLVIFESAATNLPGGDGAIRVYTRSLNKHKTSLISRRKRNGPKATGAIYGQSLSASGRYAVFYSSDPGLPSSTGDYHVYLRDLKRGRNTLIDRNSAGHVGNASASDPSISGNGRFVGFESNAPNMPGVTAPNEQALLRDVRHHKTRLVGQNSAEVPQNGYAYYPHPSSSGRWVAFEAGATNLPGGNGSDDQIYVRDMRRGKTLLLSHAGNGDPANAYANYPSISANGRWAAFYSGASNLGGNTLYTNVFRSGPIH